MTPEQRAREFVEVGFRDLGVPLEPYVQIIAELIAGAVAAERRRCVRIAERIGDEISDDAGELYIVRKIADALREMDKP